MRIKVVRGEGESYVVSVCTLTNSNKKARPYSSRDSDTDDLRLNYLVNMLKKNEDGLEFRDRYQLWWYTDDEEEAAIDTDEDLVITHSSLRERVKAGEYKVELTAVGSPAFSLLSSILQSMLPSASSSISYYRQYPLLARTCVPKP